MNLNEGVNMTKQLSAVSLQFKTKEKNDVLLFEFDVKVLAGVVHTHTANTNCCSCHSLSE